MNGLPLLTSLDWIQSLPPINIHGGGDADGGALALLNALLIAINQLIESETEFRWLPGLDSLGTNAHPLFVHFPIAFLTGYSIAIVAAMLTGNRSIERFAELLIYVATPLTALTVATGYYAAGTTPHGPEVHETIEWHERIGFTILFLTSVLTTWHVLRKGATSVMARALNSTLALILLALVTGGADLGGLIVYKHGVGVKALQSPAEAQHHLHSSPAN